MRDPDWLIEENRLENESRSRSILSISSSSGCLTEIRKMLETGTSGEAVLDTLVTNANNQKTNNFEKTNLMANRYRSESILPTYTDFDGSHPTYYDHNSKRKISKIISEFSSENLIFTIPASQHSNNQDDCFKTDEKPIQRKQKLLASMETLNDSEKYSVPNSDDNLCDDIFPISNSSKMHKSTLSLDEHVLCSDRVRGSEQKLRGNSLDAILENGEGDEFYGNLVSLFVQSHVLIFPFYHQQLWIPIIF